jgi:hypothetical protein
MWSEAQVCRRPCGEKRRPSPEALRTILPNTLFWGYSGINIPPEKFGNTIAVSGGGKTVGWRSKSTDRRQEDSSTTRSRPVLVGPTVRPLEKLRAIRAVPASRSASIQRSASASPTRAPVSARNRTSE